MIVQGTVNSFVGEILQGIHDSKDEYRIALYTRDAVLSEKTTAYTPNHEAVGKGYRAGGKVLTGFLVTQNGREATLTWKDVVWPDATITARGALIYNWTKNARAIVVLDLGEDFRSTNGDFEVTIPKDLIIIGRSEV